MEKSKTFLFRFFLTVFVGCFVIAAASVQAATEKTANPIAETYYDSAAIVWAPTVERYEAILLTVFGPEGASYERNFYYGEKPVFERFDNCGEMFPDGSCVYELRLLPVVNKEIQEILEKRRFDICTPLSEEALALLTAVVQTGSFTIQKGAIVVGGGGDPDIPDGDAVDGQIKSNDIGHLDDVYIDGSLCLGFDCTNGTSFGFDTQVFKEHNLRIYFQDTSYASSFPTNDWRIVINDSANGGGAYFSVYDAGSDGNSSTQVFTLEAGAPAHSLYVDDYGRAGFGTSTPYVELHTVDGDTPTLRLQQDGSSGFAPQSWDVAGNESNFFVRDVTNGSKLPFRIFPNTPTSTLILHSSGVGIGTTSPDSLLNLEDADTPQLRITDTTNTVQTIVQSADTYGWAGTFSTHDYRLGTDGNVRMIIDSTGNVGIGTTSPAGKLDVNGSIYQRGGVLHADYVFEPGYQLESIEEHAQFMYENKHLKAVPRAKADENGLEIVEVGSHRRGILEELEKAHIYIHQLSSQNKNLEKRLAMLEALLAQKNGSESMPAEEKK